MSTWKKKYGLQIADRIGHSLADIHPSSRNSWDWARTLCSEVVYLAVLWSFNLKAIHVSSFFSSQCLKGGSNPEGFLSIKQCGLCVPEPLLGVGLQLH